MSRQPQRVWKSFYRLKLRANFFIGTKEYQKVGFCRYQRVNWEAKTADQWGKRSPVQFIAPWTVVRSDEFVNKRITPEQLASLNASAGYRNEKNKRILATYNERLRPYTAEELSGKTHYVGDDCPGGHVVGACNVAIGAQALASETAGVENHEISRVEQPNSDNGVKGPTS